MFLINEFCCRFCNLQLTQLFIKCVECPDSSNQICLECFSKGVENHIHANNHDYRVINLDEIFTFDAWSVLDEIELLTQVFNNETLLRSDVNIRTSNYTHEESMHHLEKWVNLYMNQEENDIDEKQLYQQRTKQTVFASKEIAQAGEMSSSASSSLFNSMLNMSLIRPPIHSKQYRLMNGYRPARGDFETEYNEKFEFKFVADMDYAPDFTIGNEIQYTTDEAEIISDPKEISLIEQDLKMQVLRIYTDLVRERYDRKFMIKKFGLLGELAQNEYALALLMNKSNNSTQRALIDLNSKVKSPEDNFTHLEKKSTSVDKWPFPVKFQRLFDSLESFTQCAELFAHQSHLRRKINELKEFRSNGVRALRHAHIYTDLKLKRLNRVPSVHLGSLLTYVNRFDDHSSTHYYCKNSCAEWFRKFVLSERVLSGDFKVLNVMNSSATSPSQGSSLSTAVAAPANVSYPISHLKYKNNPLKIENYPDWEKLNEEEREFCRVARIQPSVYLRVKAILVMENKKAGFCSYSRARKIAGIDVNKTRLIHNLLLKLELVKASAPKQEDLLLE